jgi:hypothetical protein
MSIIKTLLGKIGGNTIEATGNALDNLFTSDEERLEAKRLLAEIEQRPQKAQWDINLKEAHHRSLWVAGWRPAIGWVCAVSLATYYIPQFILGSKLWWVECMSKEAIVPYPLSINGLTELTWILLGLGGFRTMEKFGGVTK